LTLEIDARFVQLSNFHLAKKKKKKSKNSSFCWQKMSVDFVDALAKAEASMAKQKGSEARKILDEMFSAGGNSEKAWAALFHERMTKKRQVLTTALVERWLRLVNTYLDQKGMSSESSSSSLGMFFFFFFFLPMNFFFLKNLTAPSSLSPSLFMISFNEKIKGT
jgi:hypothetical protein